MVFQILLQGSEQFLFRQAGQLRGEKTVPLGKEHVVAVALQDADDLQIELPFSRAEERGGKIDSLAFRDGLFLLFRFGIRCDAAG